MKKQKLAALSCFFLLAAMTVYGQKSNNYVIVLDKEYFTCYMNPFYQILEDVSYWDLNLKKYVDTIYCNKIKFTKRSNSMKIYIDLGEDKKLKEIFKRVKGSGLYKSTLYSEIHNSLSCSMFKYEHYFTIENEKIVVWIKDQNSADRSIISLNW